MKITFFAHDVLASGDHKMHELETDFGNDGYAIFFKCIEILHTCPNGDLEFNRLCKGIRSMCKTGHQVVEPVINFCVQIGLLTETKESGKGNKPRLITSKRVQNNIARTLSLIEKRRNAGFKSAESRDKLSTHVKTPSEHVSKRRPRILDHTKLDHTKLDQNISMSGANAPISETEPIPKPCLIKYGELFFRTTEERKEKLIEKFSRPLFEQELPEMDLWISEAKTPNARKYRQHDADHYLFANNWLKDKKLRYTSNGGTTVIEGESKFIQSLRHCQNVLGVSVENPNGFITKKETTNAN